MKHKYEQESHAGRGSRPRRKPKKRSGWMEVLLFYLLPFIVVNGVLFILVAAKPHITIQVSDTKDYQTATATVTVKSILPIKEFTSSQEDSPLEMTEVKKGYYTTEITRNGVIEIYVKSVNGMTDMQYEHVNILDDVAPLVGDQYSIQDGILTLTLEDSQSGLDWMSVYGVTTSGLSIAPSSVDKQTGTFTFEMNEESLIICASDLAGNPMQATFSTHTELLNPDGTPVDPAASGMSGMEGNGEATDEALAAAASPAEENTGTAESQAADAQTAAASTAAASQASSQASGSAEPQAASKAPDSSKTPASSKASSASKTAEASQETSVRSSEVSIYIDTTTP